MIVENLEKLGLTKTESELLVEVVRHKKITAAHLNKVTNIKRSTVYSACDELETKGLIDKNDVGKITYFVAKPPIVLQEYIDKKKANVLQMDEIAKVAMREMLAIPKMASHSAPRVSYAEGADVVDFLYKHSPLWDKSMLETGDPNWWGFMDGSYVAHKEYRDHADWYWPKAPSEISLKMFSNQTDIEETTMKEKNILRRQIKYWNHEDQFQGAQWVCGDYVVDFNGATRPHYIVEIVDPMLAKSLRTLYKIMWKNDEMIKS